MNDIIDNELNTLINYYNDILSSLFEETDGGKIRGAKGKLVETLAKKLIKIIQLTHIIQY